MRPRVKRSSNPPKGVATHRLRNTVPEADCGEKQLVYRDYRLLTTKGNSGKLVNQVWGSRNPAQGDLSAERTVLVSSVGLSS